MAPHYDRHADASAEQNAPRHERSAEGVRDEHLDDAAEALREVEVEAAQPEDHNPPDTDRWQLDERSIGELRAVARQLGVPGNSKITDHDELIAAIRRRLSARHAGSATRSRRG